MRAIALRTFVAAPVDRCFDLARSIDLHVESMRSTGERAIAGVTSGLIGLDQEVTWEGHHFGSFAISWNGATRIFDELPRLQRVACAGHHGARSLNAILQAAALPVSGR